MEKFARRAGRRLLSRHAGHEALMLGLPEKPEFDHPGSVLYFKVDDIRTAHETLAARGVHFEEIPRLIAKMPAYDLWMAFFRDSEGNFLSLMSEAVRPTEPKA